MKARITRAPRPRSTLLSKIRLELSGRAIMVGLRCGIADFARRKCSKRVKESAREAKESHSLRCALHWRLAFQGLHPTVGRLYLRFRTPAVVPTNAVKGRGSRHFPRLAMTRRMIRSEVWRIDRYNLWRECLGFDASRFDVQTGRGSRSRRKGRGTSRKHHEPSCKGGCWSGAFVAATAITQSLETKTLGPSLNCHVACHTLVAALHCALKLIQGCGGT